MIRNKDHLRKQLKQYQHDHCILHYFHYLNYKALLPQEPIILQCFYIHHFYNFNIVVQC